MADLTLKFNFHRNMTDFCGISMVNQLVGVIQA